MGKTVLLDKDKKVIEKMYVSGFILKDIVKKLDNTYKMETIKKYIQRNLKHLKEVHEREKVNRKETLRIIDWECSQVMSDREFVKRNLSIYKSNKNGDLVLNREVAGAVTFDTPVKFRR